MPPSCLGCCLPHNHAIHLIKTVYPDHPGEEGPRSSNLSLLVSYAQSKPAKLLKIGKYLEKRLKTDLKKERSGYVKVTFTIVMELLKGCSKHANLFATSIVNMVLQTFETVDLNLIMLATTVFCQYSAFHDHQLSRSLEFTKSYKSLVHRFRDCAKDNSQDPLTRLKLRLAGLKALESILLAETFFTNPDVESLLSTILPAVLLNVGEDPQRLKTNPLIQSQSQSQSQSQTNALTASSPAASLARLPSSTSTTTTPSVAAQQTKQQSSLLHLSGFHSSNIQDDLITQKELEHISEKIVKDLAGKSNASNMKLVLEPIFEYLNHAPLPTTFFQTLHLLNLHLPITNRSLLISYVLTRLNMTSTTPEPTKPDSRKLDDEGFQETLVTSLAYLLSKATKASLGLSVLELLDHLLKRLMKSVSENSTTTPHQDRIRQALLECIISLGRHLFYPNQLNEILEFIISRVVKEGDSGCRKWLFTALYSVLNTRWRIYFPSKTSSSDDENDEDEEERDVMDPSNVSRVSSEELYARRSLSKTSPVPGTKSRKTSLSSSNVPKSPLLGTGSNSNNNMASPQQQLNTLQHLQQQNSSSYVEEMIMEERITPIPTSIISPLLRFVFDQDSAVRVLVLQILWKMFLVMEVTNRAGMGHQQDQQSIHPTKQSLHELYKVFFVALAKGWKCDEEIKTNTRSVEILVLACVWTTMVRGNGYGEFVRSIVVLEGVYDCVMGDKKSRTDSDDDERKSVEAFLKDLGVDGMGLDGGTRSDCAELVVRLMKKMLVLFGESTFLDSSHGEYHREWRQYLNNNALDDDNDNEHLDLQAMLMASNGVDKALLKDVEQVFPSLLTCLNSTNATISIPFQSLKSCVLSHHQKFVTTGSATSSSNSLWAEQSHQQHPRSIAMSLSTLTTQFEQKYKFGQGDVSQELPGLFTLRKGVEGAGSTVSFGTCATTDSSRSSSPTNTNTSALVVGEGKVVGVAGMKKKVYSGSMRAKSVTDGIRPSRIGLETLKEALTSPNSGATTAGILVEEIELSELLASTSISTSNGGNAKQVPQSQAVAMLDKLLDN